MNDSDVVKWLDEHCPNGWDMYPAPFGAVWGWCANAIDGRHLQGKGLLQTDARRALAYAMGMKP